MKKMLRVTALIMMLILAMSSVTFAVNSNGPDYDTCPKDEMSIEDVSLFEEIIADFKAAIKLLRGVPEKHDERLELKEDKRDSLQEIVPDEFKDRFDNFNKERQHMRQSRGNSNGGFGVE